MRHLKDFFQLSNKRLLISLGLVLLLMAGSIISNRTKTFYADESDATKTLRDALTARSVGAGACGPHTSLTLCTVNNPRAQQQGVIGYTALASTMASELLLDAFDDCLHDSTTTQLLDPSLMTGTRTVHSNSCSFENTTAANTTYRFTLYTTTTIPSAQYQIILNDKDQTNGSEAINSSGTIKGHVRVALKKDKNGQWQLAYNYKSSYTITEASVQAPFTINMTGHEDLQYWLPTTLPGAAGQKITIDPQSTWKVDTEGQVNGAIAFSKKGAYKITQLAFCPQQCSVTTKEEQDLKATSSGSVTGTITAHTLHQENYTGTGTGDPTTGELHWNQDLQIGKIDDRDWKHDLKGNQETWAYTGSIKSTADIKPFQDYSNIITKALKDLSYTVSYPSGYSGGRGGTQSLTRTVHTNTEDTNLNSDITRKGDGSVVYQGSDTISGTYDNKNDPYKKCQFDMFITSPEGQKGNCIDPFSSVPQRFVQSYLRPLSVPGQFSARQTKDAAVIGSRPLKAVPNKIVVFKSFLDDDVAVTQEDFKKLAPFFEQAKQLGAEVIGPLDTTSAPKMIAALGDIKNNSWLVNVGHGNPVGLKAGKDTVPYWLINNILHQKQVKLDVFAADSCYSGRSTFAETVIAPLLEGWRQDNDNLNVGSVIGFGANGFNYTTQDIANQLRALLGCNKP